MSTAPEAPTGRFEKIRERIRARDAIALRTSAHLVIWIGFGVLLAVAPFAFAWWHQNPHKHIVWAHLVPPAELILISIAICAGALGDLLLRTFLSPELTFKIGTKIAYPLVVITIGIGTYKYATIYGGDEHQKPAASWLWTLGIVLFSLLAAAITITVNERAELYVEIREKDNLDKANKELATTKETLATVTDQLATAKQELERLGKTPTTTNYPPADSSR
ncbi:hypothetical protein [Mycobacteroides abscessus]|uniref:hypothetical protein n=1 Tax=Mycobacteroides abscessus TaxID=36809 RepID=UPI0009A61A45|nr:hypothetical protein [Mycobacteroides abscessus]SKT87731.1 Uncharacterised protein [Mycobacteroides abscessus subsp. massiliense]SKU07693.1 Uncharacterised protein [Mycobacteroides abscessus subsp. massiliense]